MVDGKPMKFDGAYDCFKRSQSNSLSRANGLMDGFTPFMMSRMQPSWINFMFKDFVRNLNPFDKSSNSILWVFGNIMTGGVAGGLSLMVTYPFVIANTLMATDLEVAGQKNFKGTWDCISRTYNTNGVTGLYRGFWIAELGIIAYRGLYFGLFDSAKHLIGN
jgi:solute carrier family 25 (mitochondrial adenine nucleotide translocator), member 4/5/6/31